MGVKKVTCMKGKSRNMEQKVEIYRQCYEIRKIYKICKGVHQPGMHNNAITGRYSDCFVYILKGSISYVFEDYQFTVQEGQLAYLPQGGKYKMLVSEEDAFIFVDFTLECELPRKGFGIEYCHGRELFEKMWITWQKGMTGSIMDCMAILYGIYADIMRLYDKVEGIPSILRRKMEKSVEDILQNYTDPAFSIKMAIENTKLSATQYRTLFSKMFHMSPKQYVLKLKLDYAKELLCQTSVSILYIAEKCGFNDGFYFSALFKKKCGCSPSEYRKMYEKNEGLAEQC